MISRKEATTLIAKNIQVLPPILIPVTESRGYVLARDVFSALDLPPFTRSAMDGYAVRSEETAEILTVIGTVKAGEQAAYKLAPGQAVKIMTGAPVPQQAGKVVMKEDVELLDDTRIKVTSYRKNTNICNRGEDIRKDECIYRAGALITPLIIANCISAGISNVPVYRRPSLALIVTGDELVETGNPLVPGKIYNSNGPLLGNLLEEHGFGHVEMLRTGDSGDSTVALLKEALNWHDMIVFTGGISVGDFDFTGESISAVGGEKIVQNIAMKPGKPLGFYLWENKPIFALPGNPVSVFLAFHLFVLPSLYAMQGREVPSRFATTELTGSLKVKKSDREQFIPVNISRNSGITPIPYHGSGHLLALSSCNAFLSIPPGVEEVSPGDRVEILYI